MGDFAFAAVSSFTIAASWTNPAAPANIDDRVSYRLYSATSSFADGTESWVSLSSVVAHPLAEATTASLLPNVTYFLRVSAMDFGVRPEGLYSESLESVLSSIISTATLADIPIEQFFVSSNVSVSSATFSWSPNFNPNGTLYSAEFSTNSGFVGAVTTSNTYVLDATTLTLRPNTTYFYRVRAVNYQRLQSGYSAILSTPTRAVAPTTVSFGVFSTSVTITLSLNPNPVNTTIVISTRSFAVSASSQTSTLNYLTLNNLVPNTTYTFLARSVNHGNIPSSSTVVADTVTLAAIPGAGSFTAVPAEVNLSSVTLSWGTNSNPLTPPTSYEMQVSTWNGFVNNFTSSETFNIFATTTGLTSGATYFFRVRTFGRGGDLSGFHSGYSYTLVGSGRANFHRVECFRQFCYIQLGPEREHRGVGLPSADFHIVGLCELYDQRNSDSVCNNDLAGAEYELLFPRVSVALQQLFKRVGHCDIVCFTWHWRANGLLHILCGAVVANLKPGRHTVQNPGLSIRFDHCGLLSRGIVSTDVAETTFTIFGLAINATYFIASESLNYQSRVSSRTIISTSTLAGIPGGSTATIVGLSSITVSWTAGPNPLTPRTSYQMQVSTSADFAVHSTSVTFNTFATTAALSINTTYFFRVSAFNRHGVPSDFNEILSTATRSLAPGIESFQVFNTSIAVQIATNTNPAGTAVILTSGSFQRKNRYGYFSAPVSTVTI